MIFEDYDMLNEYDKETLLNQEFLICDNTLSVWLPGLDVHGMCIQLKSLVDLRHIGVPYCGKGHF